MSDHAPNPSTPRTDLRAERMDYSGALLPDDLAGFDPFAFFAAWLEDAFDEQTAGRLAEPAAMVMSSIDTSHEPARATARVVLLKEWDRDGFVFYTHTDSAKGDQIGDNPGVGLLFWWPSLMRQIRIEGVAQPVSRAEVEEYFGQRPRGSQVGAWASHQSRPRDSRAGFEAELHEAEARFADVEQVPCPPQWGGYRVVPDLFEFWQGQPSRLHERVQAVLGEGSWTTTRLDP
ncbi:pyridoxamine 5'-phosphate oxidase [Aestuariimicrobium ganziense]|uniref:pyridoxamine 5'-phosphate oxidase n=1 Tax=Aestuariimicrobium ganziense TaxID=2773677 RepID=UPI00194372B1|nr:pyridoxamine 5'-phosphate oxidase [Aestuariimicrobium ganziense]